MLSLRKIDLYEGLEATSVLCSRKDQEGPVLSMFSFHFASKVFLTLLFIYLLSTSKHS